MPSAASVAAVTQDYTIELLRSGSTADINSWASEIDAGLLTAAQVATAIGASAEANLYVLPVEQLYAGLFGRVGDSGGLNVWVNQLRGGASFNSVIQSFVNSQEFTNKYGAAASVNATAFVTALYTNILGRSPDAGGLAAWTSVLSTVNVANLATVIQGILGSAEALKDDTAPIDAYLAAAGVAGTYASSIAGIFGPAGTASSNPGLTYTLTTGVDAAGTGAFSAANGGAITGNNNTIYGTFNGSNTAGLATFNAGDSLVGPAGATGNTLVLSDIGAAAETTGTTTATGISATVTNIQNVTINSGQAVVANTVTSPSGFSGLTQLTVNANDAGTLGGAANSTVTAAATTNITFTDTAIGTQTDTVNGGLNVAVTANGVTGAGIINAGIVGASAAGTLAVTENMSGTAGTFTAAAINTIGGTAVTITANLISAGQAGATTVTGGAIGVTGSAVTTSVTVNQTAPATAAVAVTTTTPAVPATIAKISPAPGTNAVTATTQAAPTTAKAAVQGVVDGVVTISDLNAASTTVPNTIATVTLSNYATGSTIKDNALTTLNLTGPANAASVLTITNAAAAPTNTTLALNVTGVGATGKIASLTDTNNEIKTLNVTTATTNSVMTFNDTGLTTLTVAGTNTLTLGALTTAKLATVTVSGAAGFNDGGLLAAQAKLTTGFTTTSSGTVTATLNDTTQSFTGSTGQDIITISADATQKITGGSATNNELIFNASSGAFNKTAAALTNTNVTGFSIFGVNSTNNYNMANFNSSFTAIDFNANNGAAGITSTITAARTGTSISIDQKNDTLVVNYVDTTGASDTTNLTIGSTTVAGDGTAPGGSTKAGAGFTTTSLTLQDANAVGINTVNVTSAGTDTANIGGAVNTITTLVDNGLGNLTVTGGAGLTIGTLNEASHQATAITITSNETGANGTVINTLTDINLGNLTFAGTNSTSIGSLVLAGGTVTNLTVTNNGTGTAVVDPAASVTDALLTTLTLNGNVAWNTNSATQVAATATGATTGFTLSGSSDNAHVNINLTGAAALSTDTISLGNANNEITDGSTAGIVKITVGTGSNLINLSTGSAATYSATVTEGTHTLASGVDSIATPTSAAGAVAPNLVVTGAVTGDLLTVADGTSTVSLTTAQQTTVTGSGTLAAAVAYVDGASVALGAHALTAFTYGGNTYVLETVAGGAANNGTMAAGNTLVELVGVHSITAAPAAHVYTLAS